MMRLTAILALAVPLCAAAAPNLYPWEVTRLALRDDGLVKRPDLMDLTWRDSGGPAGKVALAPDDNEGKTLDWKIQINHEDGIGWPSFEARPKPGKNLSGKAAISFRARALKKTGREQKVSFILKCGDSGINVPFTVPVGEWRQVVFALGSGTWLKEVDRIHFFIDERNYAHGDKLEFQIKDFRLGDLQKEPLAEGLAGASLWLGARADVDSRAVMLAAGERSLPAVLHVHNRLAREIPASAEVKLRVHEVFSGTEVFRTVKLGTSVAAGARARVPLVLDLAGVKPGYCHVLADVLVEGASVLGTRKGSDDFYLAAAGESATYSILSLRTGMSYWVMDRIHGGFMQLVDISLPHTYDPLDATTVAYGEFLRHHACLTTKVCEGYEAGMPGLALAAEAFRRSGDPVRTAFAEKLLWNACEAMFAMQDACGGVVTHVNELSVQEGIGLGYRGDARDSSYNCDQMAEWMRGLVYATLYYRRRGGEDAKMHRLNAACLKTGNFLFANCREDSDGVPDVIRNYNLFLDGKGGVRRKAYHQEGRRCDVYQPRILAGLAYTAVALTACGEQVPTAWWSAFDASVAWMDRKMKPNGWFDWQCGDMVEGGCHTFLGNIYAGEGFFGAALADRMAGRAEQSSAALKASHKAYRYVTDDCYIRGNRYQYPLEFWVGPYIYWLFAEWERHVGPEPAFRDWLETLDRKWSVERKWDDFMRVPSMNCGRAENNGMLTVAILGYLGIKQMDEIGRPWTLLDFNGEGRWQNLKWGKVCAKTPAS